MSFRGGYLRAEQLFDAALVVAFLVAVLVALRNGRRRGVAPHGARLAVATIALAAGALAARLALTQPTFLHANFRGAPLVDQILVFPQAADSLGHYGQLSFLVLGAWAKLAAWTKLGAPSLETVAAANQTFAAITLGLAGWVTARWTGRAWCAPLVVVVGALQPALVRVAASEDAHNLAVLFGWAALLAMDVYATARDRAALAAAVMATALMVLTRQTLYLWAFAVVGMAVARGGWAILRRLEMRIATALVLLAVAIRVGTTFSGEPTQVVLPAVMFSSFGMMLDLLRYHPILDIARYALLLLPLELLGIVAIARSSPVRRGYFVFLGAVFALTLPFGFPEPGVECSFRLPVMTLVLVAAGAGAEVLFRAGWTGRALLLAAAASPVALPTWGMLRARSPQLAEYLYLRDAVRLLPERFVFVDILPHEPMPSYRVPDHALRRGHDVWRFELDRISAVDRTGPVFFLAGVQCRAWSAAELAGLRGDDLSFAVIREYFRAPVAHRIFRDVRAPDTIRPECAKILAHSVPVGEPMYIEHPIEENPFALYGAAPIKVQLVRVLEDGATAAPEAAPAP